MSTAKIRARRRRRARLAVPSPAPRALREKIDGALRAELDALLHVAAISGFGRERDVLRHVQQLALLEALCCSGGLYR